MKILNKIVVSEQEPNANSLWIHKVNGTYVSEFFGPNGWTIAGGISVITGEPAPQGGSQGYVFYISDDADILSENMQIVNAIQEQEIEFGDKAVQVELKGNLNGEFYDTIGTYHNGHITCHEGSKLLIFNVNFNNTTGVQGAISLIDEIDVSSLMSFAKLEVGDTTEIKAKNIENIKLAMASNTSSDQSFFVDVAYSFGVGTFIEGVGGSCMVKTAGGYTSFYNISNDGQVIKDNTKLDPENPIINIDDFTNNDEDDNNGITLSVNTGLKVEACTAIRLETATGIYTYNKSVASTADKLVFTNMGYTKVFVLEYTLATKKLKKITQNLV